MKEIFLVPELFLWCATLFLLIISLFFPNVNRLAWSAIVTCGITASLMLLQPHSVIVSEASNFAVFGLTSFIYDAFFKAIATIPSLLFPNNVGTSVSLQETRAVFDPITTSASLFFNTLIVDSCTYYCKLALVVSTACLLIVSTHYLVQQESILLLLLSTCSMLLMISAYDCMTLYLALELQSLCFYVLAASNRSSELSTEAGLKYFVLGAFSSGILLFGCSTIYGLTGVTNWEQLAILNSTNNSVYLGILFLAVGFLFKITAVPFHMWAPDVYEGSPTYVTAFFATVPKIALLAAMVRVFSYSCVDSTWQMLFAICSCASMLVGSLAGLVQSKLKRLMAYSSIAHVGYLLIGIACGTFEGIQALFLALAIYVVMTLALFAAVLALPQQRHHRIVDLSALSSWNPVLAATLAFTLFSFAGIPPLAGFFSKYAVFLAACACGAYLLALIGVVSSVISCFYYLRVIKVMYFAAKKNTYLLSQANLLSRAHSYVLGITTLFILGFCVYPSPLLIATHQMALSFCF